MQDIAVPKGNTNERTETHYRNARSCGNRMYKHSGFGWMEWAGLGNLIFNGLVRPAPVVVVQPAPVVVSPPITYTPDSNIGLSNVKPVVDETTAAAATECEEKPYIQYKDELQVFGDEATIAGMTQISGALRQRATASLRRSRLHFAPPTSIPTTARSSRESQ